MLTDVRNGGFRKDLSLFFNDPNSGDVTNALYKNGTRGGINFRELRNFHEVSTRLTYDASSFTHPDGGSLNPKVPCLVGKADEAGSATDPHFAYLRPVVIRGAWHISAFSRPVSAAPAPLYRIYVVIEPIIWLWNPFDANLVMRPGGHLTVRCWGLPYDITIKAGTTNQDGSFQCDPPQRPRRQHLDGNRTEHPGRDAPGRGADLQPGAPGHVAHRHSSAVSRASRDGPAPAAFPSIPASRLAASSPVTLSMKASTTRGATSWGLIEFLSYVGTDSNNNYWNGGLLIDRSGWQSAILATDFPSGMFKEVPAKTFSSASNLTEAQPLALFSYLARTEREGSLRSRYLARLNPAAMGFDHQATDANTLHSLPYEPLMQPLSGGLDRGFDFNEGKGFFGASYKADFGQSHLVTHSVPRERPISLGSFQHALANGVEKWTFTGPDAGNFHDRILQPSVTQAIGNSFAPPCIAPDQTTGTFNSMPAVDHSWLANDALWDQWFVSSLADRTAPHIPADETGSARDLFERLAGTSGQPRLLPNRHYRYAGHDPAKDADDLFADTKPKADAHLKIASLLRVHGAFNINSTDPAAWLAMFRSTHGLKVPVEPCQDNKSSWETANNPIAGLLVPKGSAVKTDDLADPSIRGPMDRLPRSDR